MNAKCAAATFGEDVEVTTGLRGFYNAEGVLLSRHVEIGSIVTSDLEEDAAVGTAFVGLTGGMQKARAEAETSGEFRFVADDVAKFLERLFVFCVHWDVAENGEVVARTGAGEMFFKSVYEFSATTEGSRILFIGEELYASGFEERRLGREVTGRFVFGGEFASLDLAGFDVGLVESV